MFLAQNGSFWGAKIFVDCSADGPHRMRHFEVLYATLAQCIRPGSPKMSIFGQKPNSNCCPKMAIVCQRRRVLVKNGNFFGSHKFLKFFLVSLQQILKYHKKPYIF